MKAVDVHFLKMDVVDYYAQHDQVKVRVVYHDGKERASIKQFSVVDPLKHASEWFKDIRGALKREHSVSTLDDHPLAGHLILRFKQEEDVVESRMAKFLAQVKEGIRGGKSSNLSYVDMEKKMKSFSVRF